MTVKDVAEVMGNQFIAVIKSDDSVAYSGSANKLHTYVERCTVKEIKAPICESSATLIMI